MVKRNEYKMVMLSIALGIVQHCCFNPSIAHYSCRYIHSNAPVVDKFIVILKQSVYVPKYIKASFTLLQQLRARLRLRYISARRQC